MRTWRTFMRRGECYRVTVLDHGAVAKSFQVRYTILEKATLASEHWAGEPNRTVYLHREGPLKRDCYLIRKWRSGDLPYDIARFA